MRQLARKNFSEETLKKITWVRGMYSQWRIFHNNKTQSEVITCDLDDHETITVDNLNIGICRFITEVRKINGCQFPAKTLYEVVVCIQLHLESIGLMWKLLNDECFSDIKYTLDNVMKECAACNVGGPVRKADILTFMDKDILWEMGLLGTEYPKQLLNTVLFTLGLTCALRAGKEHRFLRSVPFHSQFTFHIDNNGRRYFRYTEDLGMKTNKGGLKHRKLSPKVVTVYDVPNSDRCPVMILSKYMSLLPSDRKCSALYL